MQITKLYSVRDSKGEIFNPPYFAKTHGEAERNFKRLVNDSQSMPSHYPEDYDLYYVGDFNDATGVLNALDTPQHIIKAISVKDSSISNRLN